MTETTRSSSVPTAFATIPNALTTTRLLLVPLIALSLMGDAIPRYVPVALFILAAVTDYFDGVIARSTKQISLYGKVFDPIADKLLICGTLLVLAGIGELPDFGLVPALVILWRELLVAGLRDFVAGAQARLPVSSAAKWKTALQMGAVGVLLAAPMLEPYALVVWSGGMTLLWLAAALSLYTGLAYGLAVGRMLRD